MSEEVKSNARKEAELIVKDAELLSERVIAQAMQRVSDIERSIQDLKIERIAVRARLQGTLDTVQHVIALDADQESTEQPITSVFRKRME